MSDLTVFTCEDASAPAPSQEAVEEMQDLQNQGYEWLTLLGEACKDKPSEFEDYIHIPTVLARFGATH